MPLLAPPVQITLQLMFLAPWHLYWHHKTGNIELRLVCARTKSMEENYFWLHNLNCGQKIKYSGPLILQAPHPTLRNQHNINSFHKLMNYKLKQIRMHSLFLQDETDQLVLSACCVLRLWLIYEYSIIFPTIHNNLNSDYNMSSWSIPARNYSKRTMMPSELSCYSSSAVTHLSWKTVRGLDNC
jgi:hypothetical protein